MILPGVEFSSGNNFIWNKKFYPKEGCIGHVMIGHGQIQIITLVNSIKRGSNNLSPIPILGLPIACPPKEIPEVNSNKKQEDFWKSEISQVSKPGAIYRKAGLFL